MTKGIMLSRLLVLTAVTSFALGLPATAEDDSPSTLGLAPPKDAVALFDGSSFDAWKPFSWQWINPNDDQQEVQWKIIDDEAMEIAFEFKGKRRKQFLCTKQEFGDYRLHLEFQLPNGDSGNSGVFFGPMYELQILNSAGKKKPGLGDCGAIYQIRVPDVNAALGPGEWQTVDLEYKAAKIGANGFMTEKGAARVTVRLNGKLIHDNFKLSLRRNKYAAFPERQTSPIVLQEHGSKVKFRNIWVMDNAARKKATRANDDAARRDEGSPHSCFGEPNGPERARKEAVDEQDPTKETRRKQKQQQSTVKKTSGATNNALASEEKLYLDRKQAFANPKKDDPDLPNVLLIGDSISIGYTAYVRRELHGKADVYRIPTNAKNSAYGLQKLDQWLALKSLKWDVIHFNWGLWDLCYRHPKSKVQGKRDKVNGTLTESLAGYKANMEKIVARLKKTDATLIWCAITPVPEGEAGRRVGDDLKYNKVAAVIMKANGVLINDLHSHALLKLPETMVRKGDVHFTEPGYIHLAKKVARDVSAALDSRKASEAEMREGQAKKDTN